MDAMQRFDSSKWLEAMKSKIESMIINNVWILIDPPEGVKPIECKWIFKKKKNADGKVETYKVRLISTVTISIMILTMMRYFLLWQCSSLFSGMSNLYPKLARSPCTKC